MPPFKDEHILIIAPGSQTTLAQLGLPESFTPAQFRCPTRMFPGQENGEWEPYRVREKIQPTLTNGHANGTPTTEVEMQDAKITNGEEKPAEDDEDDGVTYDEDPNSDEGAVYPIREGRIVDWSCFKALLTHVYNSLSPPFHTPILLIAQPAWTSKDHEVISLFIFEKFKTPAFSLMDAALAASYAYGAANATVVDIGYEKVDVTAVSDYTVNDVGRSIAIPGCGGEALTQRLLDSLAPKGFTRDMCEQLKKSNICEILPAGTPLPGRVEKVIKISSNPAAAASTGPLRQQADGTERMMNGDDDDNEGVLDVATIVASGKTSEYLAQREKEKAAKAAAKKGNAPDTAAAKPTRLPNSKRDKATFQYQEYQATGEAGALHRTKREVEVGIERFFAASPSPSNHNTSILETIAAAIHRTILAVPDISRRSDLWDSIVIIGNGSRIRGFTPALLAILHQKYLLTPSSATIFTSELPSTLSTPLPTGGTNTPLHGGPPPGLHHHPAAHGVNPLLVAATHASQNAPSTHLHPSSAFAPDHPHPSTPNQQPLHQSSHHKSTQTPTSIKTLKPPEYFPEWKEPANAGFEEAAFLGAQVAAKVVFVVDQGVSKGFMTRSEWNDSGPMGIHEFMLVT